MKVALISLGCPKNRVDCDIMAKSLVDRGWQVTDDMTRADLCLINTCGFITSAKEEAIENIFSAVAARRENPGLKIIVSGCLSERYKDEILAEIPEVDAVMGIGSNDKIVRIADRVMKGEKLSSYGRKTSLSLTAPRLISTPSHYAYLKIAEGCSNGCYYCAIPLIRGPHRSRPLQECVAEAKWLAENGVKELIIVAQDITRYGFDLVGKSMLARLIEEISKIDGIEWIRLMYAYPERLGDDVIKVMAENPKVLHYIDLPIQHINERVLKSMNRRGGRRVIHSAIDRLRRAMPDVCIRTSLIAGYPGETRQEFGELCDFVRETRFGRLGCFAFSPEEGTVAEKLDGQIPDREKEARARSVMRIQTGIMAEAQKAMVGRTIPVICDGFDRDSGYYLCRSRYDAPEIDGLVYLKAGTAGTAGEADIEDREKYIGNIFNVKITGSDLYDLYAVLD